MRLGLEYPEPPSSQYRAIFVSDGCMRPCSRKRSSACCLSSSQFPFRPFETLNLKPRRFYTLDVKPETVKPAPCPSSNLKPPNPQTFKRGSLPHLSFSPSLFNTNCGTEPGKLLIWDFFRRVLKIRDYREGSTMWALTFKFLLLGA